MEGIQVSTQAAGSNNQVSIIKVGGYIDTTTSSEVERELNALLKQRRYQIIIDLGSVDYISSAGWGIFISEMPVGVFLSVKLNKYGKTTEI
jgi:anti-anti-sigma factor